MIPFETELAPRIFSRLPNTVVRENPADAKGTPYYFDKKGVRVAKKSNQLKAASKNKADGAVLRKLLGRPSKTKTLSSCMTGISKDLKLTYANIFVQLGKKTTGGEIVYGVQAR